MIWFRAHFCLKLRSHCSEQYALQRGCKSISRPQRQEIERRALSRSSTLFQKTRMTDGAPEGVDLRTRSSWSCDLMWVVGFVIAGDA